MRMADAEVAPARVAAMLRLAVDAMTGTVLRAFADEEIRCIVLKGAALRRNLYGEGSFRPYGDADILVSPTDVARAAPVLAGLGFELHVDPLEHPFRMPEPHAQVWRRGRDEVDLHWRIAGAGAGGELTWEVLSAWTEAIVVAGAPAETLGAACTALLLALHAAHHGTGVAKPLQDLERGLDQIDGEAWSEAARIATKLDATEAFGAGLRTVPAGELLAAELGLPAARSPRVRLKATAQPPAALGVLTVLDTPWRNGRAHAVRDALIPSPEFMRAWFPVARRGRIGLSIAYVTRALTRGRQLPAAIRAARRSRRP